MSSSLLAKQIDLTNRLADRASRVSLEAYLRHVVIDSRPDPRPFGQLAEPWQWELLGRFIPALESVAGVRSRYDGPRNFWTTLPRGHDKTSSIGRLANWLLAYSRKSLNMAIGAGDSDQAGLILESMEAEIKLNSWLSSKIKPGKTRIRGPGGVFKLLSSDASTSFGLNCDVVIIEELTHWKKRDLWDVLWSGRMKRPGSIFIVITNAGTLGSWQHKTIYQRYRDDPSWAFTEADPYTRWASWMSEQSVADVRKGLPRGLAKRVLDNVWTDPAEEADFLTRAEIEACEQKGRDLGLTYQPRGRPGVRYFVGVDYGPRRDRTALAVLHREKDGMVIVDRLDVVQGSPEAPVAIRVVEEWIDEQNMAFNCNGRPLLVVDPYQMEGTIQKYEQRQKLERFESRGGKANYEMAECLRSLVSNGQIAWYPGAGTLVTSDGRRESLVDELAGLVLKPTPYGYRFDHEAHFHDDRVVAIGMASLMCAREYLPTEPVKAEDVKTLQRKPQDVLKPLQPGDWSRRGLWGAEDRTSR